MHDLDHHQTGDDAASEVTRHENDHAHAHDQDVHCHDECDGDGDVNGEVLLSHHLVMSTKPKAVVVETVYHLYYYCCARYVYVDETS